MSKSNFVNNTAETNYFIDFPLVYSRKCVIFLIKEAKKRGKICLETKTLYLCSRFPAVRSDGRGMALLETKRSVML